MKYTDLLIIALVFIVACQPKVDNTQFGSKPNEILKLNYEDITMNISYKDKKDKDTTEIARYQESMEFDSNTFELATKIARDDDSEPVVRYDVMEVDTLNKTCVRHYVDYNVRDGAIKNYTTHTLEQPVEQRVFSVNSQNYLVYKIVEKDPEGEDCRTIFLSPNFGTLLGRGEVGRYEMYQQTNNILIDSLVHQVKMDTLFVLCGLQLELYQKSRNKGDATISPK